MKNLFVSVGSYVFEINNDTTQLRAVRYRHASATTPWKEFQMVSIVEGSPFRVVWKDSSSTTYGSVKLVKIPELEQELL